jgi:hypothetical protein
MKPFSLNPVCCFLLNGHNLWSLLARSVENAPQNEGQERERTYKGHKGLIDIQPGNLGGIQTEKFEQESSHGIYDEVDEEDIPRTELL